MKLAEYIEKQGLSQREFGRLFKPALSQGLIWQWLAWLENPAAPGMARITAERAIEVEKITGGLVKREELRPDIFERAA